MKSDIKNNKKETPNPLLEPVDEKTAFSAIQTPYHHLTEEDLVRIKEREAAVSKKVECLLNEYLDESGRPLAKRKPEKKKKEAFDINKYA